MDYKEFEQLIRSNCSSPPPYTIIQQWQKPSYKSSNKASQTSPSLTATSIALKNHANQEAHSHLDDNLESSQSDDVDDNSQASDSSSPTQKNNFHNYTLFHHYLKSLDEHHHLHHHHHIHHTIKSHQKDLIKKFPSNLNETNISKERTRKLGGFSSFRSAKSFNSAFHSPSSLSSLSHHQLAGEIFAIPHSPTSPPAESHPLPDELLPPSTDAGFYIPINTDEELEESEDIISPLPSNRSDNIHDIYDKTISEPLLVHSFRSENH